MVSAATAPDELELDELELLELELLELEELELELLELLELELEEELLEPCLSEAPQPNKVNNPPKNTTLINRCKRIAFPLIIVVGLRANITYNSGDKRQLLYVLTSLTDGCTNW